MFTDPTTPPVALAGARPPGSTLTTSLRVARAFVAASALAAPIANALLLTPEGWSVWPTLLALATGAVARVAAPASVVPLLAGLALAPLWQAIAGGATGTSDPQLLMPWLAALTGWLAWPRGALWHVTGAWRFGIVAWALATAVAWPVTALRELDFTWQTIGASTLNGSAAASPHRMAAFVALVAAGQLVALLLFDWAWGAPPARRKQAWLALAPGVAMACAIAVWQMTVDPAFLSREPWIALARAAGPLFDANAMGALAVLVAAALAQPSLSPRAVPPALWTIAWSVLALAGVVASGSRTALGALAVAAGLTGVVALRGWRRLAVLGVIGALVLVAARVGAPPGLTASGNAIGRLAATVQDVADRGADRLLDLAWHRDGYGPVSMAIIAEHPWVGVGPGAFGGVVSDYARITLGYPLPPDNAQNWWRQQVADQGVLGSVGSLLCSVLAFGAVLQSWRATSRASAVRTAPLVALGLMAWVSPPTQHPVTQVLLGLLVASAVVPAGDSSARPVATTRSGSATGGLAWLLALACGAGLAVEGWTGFRPPQRAARFHFQYSYGLSEPVTTPFGDGRWSARRSVAVVLPEHRLFDVSVVLPHDDLSESPVEVTVSDGSQAVCRALVSDRTPVRCRLTVPADRWLFAQVDVSRTWRAEDGVEQAALVSGRFERLEP